MTILSGFFSHLILSKWWFLVSLTLLFLFFIWPLILNFWIWWLKMSDDSLLCGSCGLLRLHCCPPSLPSYTGVSLCDQALISLGKCSDFTMTHTKVIWYAPLNLLCNKCGHIISIIVQFGPTYSWCGVLWVALIKKMWVQHRSSKGVYCH